MVKKRFTVFLLILSLLFAFFSVSISAEENEKRYYSALLVGLDDAANNTDVISMLVYDCVDNIINILQLPRDTLYKSDDGICKLNSLYARSLNNKNDERKALSDFSKIINDILQIKSDFNLSFTTRAFVELIDSIGGIYVYLPRDLYQIIGKDLTFTKEGDNHFCGSEALRFVRYRKNYKGGDIQRLNTQKIFFEGLFRTLKSRTNLFDLLFTCSKNRGVVLDYSFKNVIPLLNDMSKIPYAKLNVQTMPGNAVIIDKTSYYVLERDKCFVVLKSVFADKTVIFDPKKKTDYSLS